MHLKPLFPSKRSALGGCPQPSRECIGESSKSVRKRAGPKSFRYVRHPKAAAMPMNEALKTGAVFAKGIPYAITFPTSFCLTPPLSRTPKAPVEKMASLVLRKTSRRIRRLTVNGPKGRIGPNPPSLAVRIQSVATLAWRGRLPGDASMGVISEPARRQDGSAPGRSPLVTRPSERKRRSTSLRTG